jgi:hypothetical protein
MADAAKTRRLGEDVGIKQYEAALKRGGPSQTALAGAISRQQKAKMGLIGGTLKKAGAQKPMLPTGVQAPVDMQQQKTVETLFEKAYSPEDIAAAEAGERARYQQTLAQGKATTDEAARRREEQRQKVLQTIGRIGGGAVKAAGMAMTAGAAGAIPGALGKVLGTAGKSGVGKALSAATGQLSPEQVQQQNFISDLQEKARAGDKQAQQQLLEYYKA